MQPLLKMKVGEYIMQTRTRFISVLLGGIVALFQIYPAQGALLFDNGSADVTNTTWNVTAAPDTTIDYAIVDEFSLGSASIITEISFDAWHVGGPTYVNTSYAIYASLPAVGTGVNTPLTGVPLVSGTVVDTIVSNGLVNTANQTNPPGFTHTISGLSIALTSGIYYLSLSINEPAFTTGAFGIGSGSGTSQTIGTGLYHYYFNGVNGPGINPIRRGDHLAFRVLGSAASVPLPSSLALIGLGLAGIGYRRRNKIKAT